MDEDLASRFEADRRRLQAVAYRILGSVTEAEDAVQGLGSDSASRTPRASMT